MDSLQGAAVATEYVAAVDEERVVLEPANQRTGSNCIIQGGEGGDFRSLLYRAADDVPPKTRVHHSRLLWSAVASRLFQERDRGGVE